MLAATRQVLAESGYAALTYSEVASRAGVTRQLVHRWWKAKASLVAEAVFGSGTPTWTTTWPGPLAQDLRTFVGEVVGFACRPDVRAGVAGLMADADVDTPLPGLTDGLLVPLRASLRSLVDAAEQRGEIREGIDVDLTLDTVRGAVTMHLLADSTPPEVVVEHLGSLLTWALTPTR